MDQSHQLTVVSPSRSDRLETVVSLLTKHQEKDYFAYELENVWHVGLGSHASLRVDATGKTAVIDRLGHQELIAVPGSLTELARQFSSKYSPINGKTFGYVGFNFGAHIRGQQYKSGLWSTMSLLVPITEVTLKPDEIVLKGYNEKHLTEVWALLKTTIPIDIKDPLPVNTQSQEEEYKTQVTKALTEMEAMNYIKVILSRTIALKERVDMPATMLTGRRSNTPARTYILLHAGFQATGFSPELVVPFQHGKVVTEPLAGTRSRVGTHGIEKLGHDLINDQKEIVEHVISVREAISELSRICAFDTIAVTEFVSLVPFNNVYIPVLRDSFSFQHTVQIIKNI